MMNFRRPTRFEEALSLLGRGGWSILAGGTDVYPSLDGAQPSGNIIDITGLACLRNIVCEASGWRIGALVTWSDLIAADLPTAFDGLKLAAREVGSVQIQNRATIVGNICNASPAADGVPPLLCLNALVCVSSASASRQIALADFLTGSRATALGEDEMVTALLIPRQSAHGSSSFLKLGARKYLVISIAMAAVRLAWDHKQVITDAAVAVGSCTAVAKRIGTLEGELTGRTAPEIMANGMWTNPASPEHFFSGLAPIDDVRASRAYRLEAAWELVCRAVHRILAPS